MNTRKVKVKVANVGQKIIDDYGYIYQVQDVKEKFVSIGNGEFIMHQNYSTLPDDFDVSLLNKLTEAMESLYEKYGCEYGDELMQKVNTRLFYSFESNKDPRHICSFEDYCEYEGDNNYEYERISSG